MIGPKVAAFRVAYVTDLRKVDSLALPLGFIVEGVSADRGRFLGLVFRTSLTQLERDRVNLRTWPELDNLESYMSGLFKRAWDIDPLDGDATRLGIETLACAFSSRSALQLSVAEPPRVLSQTLSEIDKLEDKLFRALSEWKQDLKPMLIAPVIPIPKRRRVPAFAQAPSLTEKLTKTGALPDLMVA